MAGIGSVISKAVAAAVDRGQKPAATDTKSSGSKPNSAATDQAADGAKEKPLHPGTGSKPSSDANAAPGKLLKGRGEHRSADAEDRPAAAESRPATTSTPFSNTTPNTDDKKPGNLEPNRHGVVRNPIPRDQLEELEILGDDLAPPTDGEIPDGVEVEERDDGTRIVSINIHQAAPLDPHLPEDRNPLARSRQELDALQDVARFVNSIDPDVIAVQEVNDHADHESGVPHQASVLYHLLGAEDMAFTPALDAEGEDIRHYGVATYTRNGYSIGMAANVDLPNNGGKPLPEHNKGVEDRSAGVMEIVAPDGDGESFTFINAHLSAGADHAQVRSEQLAAIQSSVEQIQGNGTLSFHNAISEQSRFLYGFDETNPVVVAGDFNTGRDRANGDNALSPDAALQDLGLIHVATTAMSNEAIEPNTTEHGRIDHIYVPNDVASATYQVGIVPSVDTDQDFDVTDHNAVVSDIHF